jgi:heme/copper-type cytochrome/quinol oxidase subunit 3
VQSRHPMWEQETISAEGTEHQAVLEPLQSGPTRWRGAVVVDVVDAEPRAVVHIPTSTPVPFVMAVGFLFIFAAALLDSLIAFGIGAIVTLASLVGWFWPQRTERIAIEEVGPEPHAGRLPLAVAGPMANGYWGTVVFLLVLATAFGCVVASYYYLAGNAESWPPPRRFPGQVVLPSIAAALLAVAGVATWWLRRAVRGEAVGGTRAALALAFLGHAGAVWATWRAFGQSGLTPVEDAYASAFVATVGFQWLVGAVVLAMLVIAQLWAWLRPRDVRGDAVAYNASLVSYFAAASGLLALAVLYVTPRFW